jgi:hypothetical protein
MRIALAILLLIGCGDTGQPAIEHRAVAMGTAARAVDVGDYSITLEQARIGFGPAIFCASRAASNDQCPSALAELASAATVDALNVNAQPIGTVQGFTGTVRSVGFELAITWLGNQSEPVATRAAVDGHSAHLEGRAVHKMTGASFRFIADVDIAPLIRGAHAITAGNLNNPIDTRTRELSVRFDPNNWLAQIDFAELATAGPPTVMVTPGSRAHNALVVGITSLAPPQFTFR